MSTSCEKQKTHHRRQRVLSSPALSYYSCRSPQDKQRRASVLHIKWHTVFACYNAIRLYGNDMTDVPEEACCDRTS